MPDADFKLDGGNAIVEGNWLLIHCLDLKLDAPSRRSAAGGERRALVHGFSDELVVNYADDYPGGVTINGDVRLPGKIKEDYLHLETHDVYLDHPGRRSATTGHRRALVHGFNDELALNWAKDYPGGTVVHGNLEVQKGGALRLSDNSGDVVAEVNVSGNLTLGGGGVDGDIMLKDSNGDELIRIGTQYKRIDFKEAGDIVKVRVDSDDFSSTPWPAWQGEGAPSRLNLIQEMRRMKEEILALRFDVEALKAAP